MLGVLTLENMIKCSAYFYLRLEKRTKILKNRQRMRMCNISAVMLNYEALEF